MSPTAITSTSARTRERFPRGFVANFSASFFVNALICPELSFVKCKWQHTIHYLLFNPHTTMVNDKYVSIPFPQTPTCETMLYTCETMFFTCKTML
jgi:hypothetical protein